MEFLTHFSLASLNGRGWICNDRIDPATRPKGYYYAHNNGTSTSCDELRQLLRQSPLFNIQKEVTPILSISVLALQKMRWLVLLVTGIPAISPWNGNAADREEREIVMSVPSKASSLPSKGGDGDRSHTVNVYILITWVDPDRVICHGPGVKNVSLRPALRSKVIKGDFPQPHAPPVHLPQDTSEQPAVTAPRQPVSNSFPSLFKGIVSRSRCSFIPQCAPLSSTYMDRVLQLFLLPPLGPRCYCGTAETPCELDPPFGIISCGMEWKESSFIPSIFVVPKTRVTGDRAKIILTIHLRNVLAKKTGLKSFYQASSLSVYRSTYLYRCLTHKCCNKWELWFPFVTYWCLVTKSICHTREQ